MKAKFGSIVEKRLGKLPLFIICVLSEWIIIFLLLVDGFLAFFCHEFARLFDLKPPCLLCTRIDHLLLHRSSDAYYNDSICGDHKKDISSLAYCSVHRRLSDIRTMCKGCLISFAMEKDPNLDKYKSLVGKLKKDVDFFNGGDDQKFKTKTLRKDEAEIAPNDKTEVPECSCCGEPLKSSASSKYKGNMSTNGPNSSPIASTLRRNEDEANVDFPTFRYTELKLVADSELELPEDEDALNMYNPGRLDAKSAAVEDINSDFAARTPSTRINKFFGISLLDSTVQMSPRWASKGIPLSDSMAQMSPRWASKGIPLSDSTAQMSPRWSGKGGKNLSFEKLDFIIESSDLEGDLLTRMKRQIRLDRKALSALQMELDEERSAAAVAANNAMAMIGRLQAEKAAVQMEAFQYQRMAEEQAEYDQEALQMLRDLLFKREEEMKAMESELEMYREKYGHIKKMDSERYEVDASDYQDDKSQPLSPLSEKSSTFIDNKHDAMEYEDGIPFESSSLDFEGERAHLLSLVRDLEEEINVHAPASSESSTANHDDYEENKVAATGDQNTDTLRRVSTIQEQLRAIEKDSSFIKHVAMTMQRGSEGTKLLHEIAQHLRDLRQLTTAESPSEVTVA